MSSPKNAGAVVLPGVHVTPPGLLRVKARKLRLDLSGAYSDIDRAVSVVESLLGDLEDLGAPPEPPGATNTGAFGEGDSIVDVVTGWLDRQRYLGLLSPEGIAAVEKLIAEVG